MESIIGHIVKHHIAVVVISFVLTLLAGFIVATRWNIDSDFKALLPQESAAARAMTEVGDRVGSGSALFVVIDSPDQQANIAFATKYAEELRKIDEVALAHFHNDKAFFEKHALLFVEAEDLAELRGRLQEAIREAKKQANPLFVSLGPPKAVELETSDITEKYSADLVQNRYKEYLISDDGYSLTIIVRFVETSTNLLHTNALLDRVKEVGDQLDPRDFHPEMEIELGGGLVNRKKEYDSLINDVQTSAVTTVFGLFTIIAVYFRRLRAVLLVLAPLVLSVVWTLAIALLIFGALTTISAFIFAILLGLAIDFSIHLLSSYDSDRAAGMSLPDALKATYTSTGRATALGAATTFGVFVVLSFAQFRGLSQFGVVAAIGVIAAAVAMTTTLPSLIVLMDRWAPAKPAERRLRISAGKWKPRTAWLLLGVAALFTAFSAWHLPKLVFEENFRKVGDIEWPWLPDDDPDVVQQQTERAGRIAAIDTFRTARELRRQRDPDSFVMDREQHDVGRKYATAVGSMQTSTPTVVLFDTEEDTARVYHELQNAMTSESIDTIQGVGAIWAFVPPAEAQRARLAEIHRIKALIEAENVDRFKPEHREMIEEIQPQLEVDTFTHHDLPDWTKRLFMEAGPDAKPAASGEEFAYQYTIYLNEKLDAMVGKDARRFLGDVLRLGEEAGLELRVASPSVVYVAMLDNIQRDGLRMLGYAMIFVVLVLALGFRSVPRALFSMIPLVVGVFWMLGVAAFFGLKLDFFNVIIMPVIIGIGIDDGVHFYYHWLETKDVSDTMHRVGAAVTMTSATSVIGFMGLAVTDYAGLASIGQLAVLGIVTTWLATLLLMPPMLRLRSR